MVNSPKGEKEAIARKRDKMIVQSTSSDLPTEESDKFNELDKDFENVTKRKQKKQTIISESTSSPTITTVTNN